MSRGANNGCAFFYIIILLLCLSFLVIRGCIRGDIELPSRSHHSTSYYQQQEREKRISKQLEKDIKNHAEYQLQVTCPNCHGLKNMPDLDNPDPNTFKTKPCPVCKGRGWVVETHHW